MNVIDLLETRVVPLSMLHRMMRADGGVFLSVDLPPTQRAVREAERQLGELPADLREWVAEYGSGAMPNESGLIFGVSVSNYKSLGLFHEGCLVVGSFDEGDDLRYIDSDGGIASTDHGEWYPSFSSFVAAVLCMGNGAVLDEFVQEIRELPSA